MIILEKVYNDVLLIQNYFMQIRSFVVSDSLLNSVV
jgi:hypothetical protein